MPGESACPKLIGRRIEPGRRDFRNRSRIESITFIFVGPACRPCGRPRIDFHRQAFPSDHAAVVSEILCPDQTLEQRYLRIVSYNMRRGLGTDNRTDLRRTTALLANCRPDIVGLQEVDRNVRRSDQTDQPQTLATALDMHVEFGSFMEYDGGQYGLAILSRFPVEHTERFRLPAGNEPRVALLVTVRLPDGRPLTIVNVHFDWVGGTTRFDLPRQRR